MEYNKPMLRPILSDGSNAACLDGSNAGGSSQIVGCVNGTNIGANTDCLSGNNIGDACFGGSSDVNSYGYCNAGSGVGGNCTTGTIPNTGACSNGTAG